MRSSKVITRRWAGVGVVAAALALLLSGAVTAATTTWDLEMPSAYVYPATVEIAGGVAQLVPNPTPPPWWDRDWAYRQEISISNGLGVTLPAGATVRLRLGHKALADAGKAQADGDDVRLVYRNRSQGTWTELDRAVLPGANGWNVASPATTDIWFKTQADIPTNTADGDYYLYYGNPEAAGPPNSLAAVFAPQTKAWPVDLAWSGTFNNTRVFNNTVQLGPVAQSPRLLNAADSAAYEWNSGGGYAGGSTEPPLPGDGGWVQVTDPVKLSRASVAGAGDSYAVWETRVTTARDQWDWQKVKFRLSDTKFQRLDVQWKGWGDPAPNYNVYLYLLNPATQEWDRVESGWAPNPNQGEGTLTLSLADPALARSYVNGAGEVWAAVGAKHSNYGPEVAPTLVSPASGVWVGTDYAHVTFSWNPVTQADRDGDVPTRYVLKYRYLGATGWPNQVTVEGATSHTVYFGSAGTYEWTVAAKDADPNGMTGPDAPARRFIIDVSSSGSCPFLLVWNGREYEYVTDIAGQPLDTPFMKPNLPAAAKRTLPYYVPYLTPAPQLVPDEQGRYRMKLREGQWEIDFVDEIKLWLVDVPEGYEVRSSTGEDRVKLPAPNTVRLYTIKDPHPVVKATALDGSDLTDLLRAKDGRGNPPSASDGLILDFGPIDHPEYAKLLIDGWKWTEWSETIKPGPRENIALDVPGADGKWVEIRRIGPPNAAPDSMVIDLAGVWPTRDHRLRIRNLKMSRITTVLDRVALDDSAPVEPKITAVSPLKAELTHPGVNTYRKPTAEHAYLVWDDVRADLPVNWARGKFTRLGDVRPLLEARDDKYVVMQSGDALELVFPDAAPPAPGFRRIPAFYGDLFYRDQPKSSEPLPFHAMTDYPYQAPEKYPDDAERRKYLAEWNTREYPGPFMGNLPAKGSPAPAQARPAGPTPGSPAPAGPAASDAPDEAPHSLNTDYLALIPYWFVSPSTYLTQKVSVPGGDQIIAVTVNSYAATTPGGTSVSLEASADGGSTWQPVSAPGQTLYFAPNPANTALQFRATLTTGDKEVTPSFDSLSVTYYTRTIFGGDAQPTVMPIGGVDTRFAAGSSAITPVSGVPYTSLSSFSAVPVAGTPVFQISADNGTTWKYWTGSAWADATDPTMSNPASVINDHLAPFLALTEGLDYGMFKWRAYLTTDGFEQVSLGPVSLVSTAPDTVYFTALPVSPTAKQGDSNVVAAKLAAALDAGEATLHALTVTLTGTGAANQIGEVKLWRAAGDGSFTSDPGHLLATAAGFAGTTATLAPAGGLVLSDVATTLYVTLDIKETAAVGATYGLSVADAAAITLDADKTASAPFPLLWDQVELTRAPKQVAITGSGIQPSEVIPGLVNVPVLAFRPSVVSDDTTLTAATLTLNGSPLSGLTRVKLWRDDGDGTFSPAADTLLVGLAPSAAEITLTPATPQTVAATDDAWFYVSYDLSAAVEPGRSYGASLTGLDFTLGDQATGLPIISGDLTVQPPSAGLQAADNTTYTIRATMDNDPARPGVQTVLYGDGAVGQVTVTVTNHGVVIYQNQTAAAGDGSWSMQPDWRPGVNLVEVTDGAGTIRLEVDLIDPAGIVYDAITGLPVAGATLAIYRESDPAVPLETQTTDAHGQYSFLVPAGAYFMTVTAAGYSPAPPGSRLVTVPAGNGLGTVPGSQDGEFTDIYYGAPFTVDTIPLHFDIPLDPAGFEALTVTKTADRPIATVGDLVTFRVRIQNPRDSTWADLRLRDILPPALRYLAHTTQADGQNAPDPEVSGDTLTFTGLTIPAGGELSLTYRVVVSPSAAPGTYVNTAAVQRAGSQARLSNIATATVQVVKDQLFQTANVLGRVFRDDNGNGFPDDTEPGLGGVKVVADDGAILTTDVFGRFHLSGLTAASKAFKLDPATLPAGAALTTPNPVLVTLRPGLPSEVSFGVAVPVVVPDPASGQPAGSASGQPVTDSASGGAASSGFHLAAGEARLSPAGVEGRLAGYLRREIGAGVELIASLDTERRKTTQPAGTEEQGYATFGDQSAADLTATKTSGPLYLSVTGPGFAGTWGDFRLPAPEDAGRAATGARLSLQGAAGAGEKPGRSLELYAGSLAYPKVRDELRAQDGSLYHLSHRPVAAGTERLWLEVRDEVTARVVARIDLSRGKDYDVDYPGGRVITRIPLPATVENGSLLGQPVEADRPVYLVADYQYDPGTAFSPTVYGGRAEMALGGNARGSVALDLAGGGGSLTGEIAGQPSEVFQYRLQAGSGHAAEVLRYTSDDGGVTYRPAAAPAGDGSLFAAETKVAVGRLAAPLVEQLQAPAQGAANPRLAERILARNPSALQSRVAGDLRNYWKPEESLLSLDRQGDSPGEGLTLLKTGAFAGELRRNQEPLITPGWWKTPEGLVLEGKVTETTAGYTAGVDPAAGDQTRVDLKLIAKPGTGTTLTAASDANYTGADSDRKVTAGMRLEQEKVALTTELGQLTSGRNGAETVDRTLAAKYEYRLSRTTTLSVGRKIDYEQPDLNVTSLGAAAVFGRTKLELEYDTGEKQSTRMANLAYALPPGGRLYSGWEGGERDGTPVSRFVFGGSAGVSEHTRLFLERKLDVVSGGVAASETAGAQWRPSDRFGYSFAFGHGQAVNGADRSSGSVALDYRGEGRLGSAALEVANQSDGRRDVALRGKAEGALTPAVTLVGRILVSQTGGAGFTGGNVSEVAVGTAYRPVAGDRLNLLNQMTFRSERGDPSGTGVDAGSVNSLVLSSEGVYRLNRSWRLGGKVAWKRAATGDGLGQADTLLLASRVLYQVVPGVELAGEYRVVRQGDEFASGPVFEADFAFPGTRAVWLGFGYNYAGFSDSLLGDTKEAGWFLRLRGLL